MNQELILKGLIKDTSSQSSAMMDYEWQNEKSVKIKAPIEGVGSPQLWLTSFILEIFFRARLPRLTSPTRWDETEVEWNVTGARGQIWSCTLCKRVMEGNEQMPKALMGVRMTL